MRTRKKKKLRETMIKGNAYREDTDEVMSFSEKDSSSEDSAKEVQNERGAQNENHEAKNETQIEAHIESQMEVQNGAHDEAHDEAQNLTLDLEPQEEHSLMQMGIFVFTSMQLHIATQIEVMLEHFDKVDPMIVVYGLGFMSAGAFGTVIGCASVVVAANMIFQRCFASQTYVVFANAFIYVWILTGIALDALPIMCLGSSELAYNAFKAYSNGMIHAQSAAMIAIALNLMWTESYLNIVCIVLNQIMFVCNVLQYA